MPVLADNSCLVPANDIEIAGIYLHQPVNELNSKLHLKIKKNVENVSKSKEGAVEPLVYSWDFQKESEDFPDVKDKDLGKLSFSGMSYNIATDRISSFVFASNDIETDSERLKDLFLKKTHIPLNYWVKTGEILNYKCSDYQLNIVENTDRGELFFSFISKDSDEFNNTKVKTVYHFTAKDLLTSNTQKILIGETYSGFDLYNNDSLFKSKLDRVLFNKIGLSLEDFDMGSSFTPQDLNYPYIFTHFYQKNKTFKNKQLTTYIAYNSENNDMVVVLTDDEDGVYVLGDKDEYLFKAMKKYSDFPEELYDYLR